MKSFIISFILISIIPASFLNNRAAKASDYSNTFSVKESSDVLSNYNTVTKSGFAENELFWQVNLRTKQIELYMQQDGKPVLLEAKENSKYNTNIANAVSHSKVIVTAD